jgi:hypothetical protein
MFGAFCPVRDMACILSCFPSARVSRVDKRQADQSDLKWVHGAHWTESRVFHPDLTILYWFALSKR